MKATGPIGIICAMESEAALLVKALEEKEKITVAGSDYYAGTLCGTPAVVVQCGIGKVNAARCTQALIDRFSPRCVINSGIAGGVGEGLHVGDVVLGAKLVEHDYDLTALGYAKGNVCAGNKKEPTYFRSDPALIDAIEAAAKALAPDRGIHRGVIASGDVFVSSKEVKAELRSRFNALAAEMEGAALAHTAEYAGVPYAVIRVISDLADGGAPVSYTVFENKTASLSAKIMMAMAEAAKA